MQEPGFSRAADDLTHYREVVADRDRLVRTARESGISIRGISQKSGLSRTTVYRILGQEPGPEDGDTGGVESFTAEARTERARCAALLRGLAAGARRNGELVAATAMARLANEIDPLGPVMGAPAAGGTT